MNKYKLNPNFLREQMEFVHNDICASSMMMRNYPITVVFYDNYGYTYEIINNKLNVTKFWKSQIPYLEWIKEYKL